MTSTALAPTRTVSWPNSQTMRLAVLSTMPGDPWPWGGSEALWHATASAALRAGHTVGLSLYAPVAQSAPARALQANGAQIFARRRRLTRWSRALTQMPWLDRRWAALRRFRPDVLLINQGSTFDLAVLPEYAQLMRELQLGRYRYMVISHGGMDGSIPDEASAQRARQLFAGAAATCFVSQRNIAIAERQLATPLAHASVVQNPLAVDLAAPPPAWPPTHELRLASVARLDPGVKGFDLLLEILAGAAWSDRAWRLTLYGDGPPRDYLARLAAHYGIAQRLHLPGFAHDIRTVWAENHLMLLPSRTEALPTSLLEALLCGRPVVATDVGGVSEWVSEPLTGFLAEGATVRSFGAALERAWAAREQWAAIGARGRAEVERRLDRQPDQTVLTKLTALAQTGVVPA